jgi:pimeloyl-ACP methyl ester carboxylesterase
MMPDLTVNNQQLTYLTEGDGFPLILVPDCQGTRSDWHRPLPLLGELCRVIAYEYCQPHSPAPPTDLLVEDLRTVFAVLSVERAYLAGYAGGGQTALHFALRYPACLEGLLLVGMPGALPDAPLHNLTVPTCVLVGAEAPTHLTGATLLTTQAPHCTKRVIPAAGTTPLREQPLAFGHAMMDFLIRCERQRNLVRGASFLL